MQYANSTVGNNEPQRPESALESAVSSLGSAHESLRHALYGLAEKLTPVLQPEIPAPAQSEKATRGVSLAEAPRSQVLANLHGERNVVEGLTNFVNSLSGRLDT